MDQDLNATDGRRPRRRVLLLAESCNPEWPSLPIVGYKYARALARHVDVVVATQVRNRPNIEKARPDFEVAFIDTEYVAKPIYRLSTLLRGGKEVAWSTNAIMNYLPYVEFERQVLKRFGADLRAGRFDLVHRITPMSPTSPSYIAGRVRQPFLIGPLNGGLAWPEAFREEQKREKEKLRIVRNAYRLLPFARSTFRRADAVLAAFEHTIRDLPGAAAGRIVNMPEIGYDPEVFHDGGRTPAFSGPGPYRFLFAGRLVPYKVPDVAIRAFATSPALSRHVLHIVGDGPELGRLKAIVAEAGAGDRILFEGRKSQAEVAGFMRRADGFVFPSIRELGAGVVIEAMACGAVCFVADYGAPGHLVADGRGASVPVAPAAKMAADLCAALEAAVAAPAEQTARAARAKAHAERLYPWDVKARITVEYYEDLLAGRGVVDRGHYL